MSGERYSRMSGDVMFGMLVNGLEGNFGEDKGSAFPFSDSEDMSRGARFIPHEVTLARRNGETVEFVTKCTQNCWHWILPNGEKIYNFDAYVMEQIAAENGKEKVDGKYVDGPGPCPHCGNPNTHGGPF